MFAERDYYLERSRSMAYELQRIQGAERQERLRTDEAERQERLRTEAERLFTPTEREPLDLPEVGPDSGGGGPNSKDR